MQDIQFKANSGQFNIDEAQGIVECFVAGIGNKDSVGDIVVTGAFSKSLMRRKPRVVWGHNWNDPIGKVLEIYEVPPNDPRLPQKMKMAGIGGLYAKVQFNLNSEKGREAFTNVAFFGEEQEWSIGYKTLDAIFDNSRQANVLKEVELYELSPVLHGANQLTGTISVKSEEEKMHMYPMGGVTAVAIEKPKTPVDPFAQGIAQPADSDRMIALEQELTSRTGGPIKVMKATESFVLFMKPGKGMFRLAYYFDGNQWMFGKPEQISPPTMMQQPMQGVPRPGAEPKPQQPIPNFPGVQRKPYAADAPLVPVKYGDANSQSGFFDSLKSEKSLDMILDEKLQGIEQKDIAQQLLEITSSLQDIINVKTEEDAWMIPCKPETAFATKQALDPIFDFHRIETVVTEDGIVLTSPLTNDAYEAIGTATKNLIGRIGRGLVPGGGGKVRRGRTALSRLTGELDPRKRRDVDNDGIIFDGTWREMPAPIKPQFTPRRGLSSESASTNPDVPPARTPAQQEAAKNFRKQKKGPKDNEPSLWYQRWALENPPRIVVPFIIPRMSKPKLVRMFNDFLKDSDLPEESIVRKIASAIESSSRYTELQAPGDIGAGGQIRAVQTQDFLPKIDVEMLEEFRKIWPDIKDKLKEFGGHRDREKGRTSFEILNTLVETGEYERKNKPRTTLTTPLTSTPRVVGETNLRDEELAVGYRRVKRGVDVRAGKASARVGEKKKSVYPKNIEGPPFVIEGYDPMRKNYTLKIKFEKNKKNLLKPYIEAGLFPEGFQEMPLEKQFAWFKENGSKLVSKNDSQQWKALVRRFEDYLYQEIFKKEEDEERKLRKPTTPKPDTPRPEIPRPKPEPQTPVDVESKPGKKKSSGSQLEKQLTAISETISEWLQSGLNIEKNGKVGDDLTAAAKDLMERVIATAIPDEDGPSRESVKEALDVLDEGLIAINKLKSAREKQKFNTNEEALNAFLFRARPFLEDFGGRDSDIQQDLDDQEVTDAFNRRARRVSRSGRIDVDEDDPEELFDDEGDDFPDDDFDDNFGRRGLSSSTVNRSMVVARRFQKSNKLKKQSGSRGLASSTTKSPRTEITNESTWWKNVSDSLVREIAKADSKSTKQGLTILQQKIQKYEAAAFTPGSKRTNVGSIKISADEADQILDAVMAVIDRQKTAGKGGGVGSRGEIFAELLEKIASSAMSTFVDKTIKPVDDN